MTKNAIIFGKNNLAIAVKPKPDTEGVTLILADYSDCTEEQMQARFKENNYAAPIKELMERAQALLTFSTEQSIDQLITVLNIAKERLADTRERLEEDAKRVHQIRVSHSNCGKCDALLAHDDCEYFGTVFKNAVYLGYGSKHDLEKHSIPWADGNYCYECLDRAVDNKETVLLADYFFGSGIAGEEA